MTEADDAAPGEEGVACPQCGATATLTERRRHADPDGVAVDKIVFDGVARWVEFDDELVYRVYRCPECDREVRQVEWDGETETPVLVPAVEGTRRAPGGRR